MRKFISMKVDNCLAWCIVSLILLGSCNKETSVEDNRSKVSIRVNVLAYGAAPDSSKIYQNASNESFQISRCKFYLSSVELTASNGQVVGETDSYHLIDGMDPESQSFTFLTEKGLYDSLHFWIGVDSARNVSGAQSGALDPANGMFWTWNTGYIFAKLEGRSPASTAVNQQFTYHIGGFKTNENALRKISLPAAFQLDKEITIELTAELANWFDGKESLRIASNPTVMKPGITAMKFADNYARMFSINRITGQ
jgi:hypothetical protein